MLDRMTAKHLNDYKNGSTVSIRFPSSQSMILPILPGKKVCIGTSYAKKSMHVFFIAKMS